MASATSSFISRRTSRLSFSQPPVARISSQKTIVIAHMAWRSIGSMLLASSRHPSRPRIRSTTAITAMIRERVRAWRSASSMSCRVMSKLL
jgi:hypothetical protein